MPVVGKDVVRHRSHHRGVGVGLDGDPPCVVGGGGIGVLRVDADELAAALLGEPHVIERVAAVERVGRVPAPHDHQLGVGERVVLVAVLDGAEGHARGECRALIGRHRPRTGAAAEHAEEASEKALDLIRLVQDAVRRAGIRLVEERRGAVLALQVDHALGDVRQGFVPADALELALATLADALHRIKKTLRRIQTRAIGASTQTGADLRLFLSVLAEGSVRLIAAVVGRQPNDDVTLLVRNQRVARSAVVRAARHNGRQLVVARVRVVGEGLCLVGRREWAKTRSRNSGRAGAQLQDIAAVGIETGLQQSFAILAAFGSLIHGCLPACRSLRRCAGLRD